LFPRAEEEEEEEEEQQLNTTLRLLSPRRGRIQENII
jgi:hypothetical protein